MNIVYGVSGEGYGHSSHASAISSYLKKNNHNILIIAYGKSYDILAIKFKTLKVNGLQIICEDGAINHLKTIIFNLKNFKKNTQIIRKLIKEINHFKPDLFISDMEPISAYLSYYCRIPLLTISNQNRFINYKLKIPAQYKKDFFIAKLIIKLITPKADYKATLSFEKLKSKNRNSFCSNPIIREEVLNLKPNYNGKLLVYLSKKNKKIINVLKKSNREFIIYGYDINKKVKNLEYNNKKFFLKDLEECKAIISTSGFTSIGEAIYLKKPYLAIPLKGQFEQLFNAIYVKQKKIGLYTESLTLDELNEFISNLEIYKENLNKIKINHEEIYNLIDKILSLVEKQKANNNLI